nr:type VI secretion system baseplate subunit TssF [uncultured Cohaesibacter sp.]
MNREFLELYEHELQILYERSKEFAQDYPGIAERLGGMTKSNIDPGLAGVLEGSAFLAARVQLKLRSEFSEFTSSLIEQLLPSYLEPTPSVVMVQANPKYEDPNLKEGLHFSPNCYLDSTYQEHDKRISCRFRLASNLGVWPLRLKKASYFSSPTPLQALGLDVLADTEAGLCLTLEHRIARETEPDPIVERTKPPIATTAPLRDLLVDQLPVHLTATMADAAALYEQIFANCKRITLRYLDKFGDAQFLNLPLARLEQVGFDDDERLFEEDDRIFPGFSLLREFFTLPEKFMGFRLTGLRELLARIAAHEVDILFEFGASVSNLANKVSEKDFGLYVAPAINLFKMKCSRVPISSNQHEYLVVPDRSRWLDFEPHRILSVDAHFTKVNDKIPVYPIYNLPPGNIRADDAYFFSCRRVQRRKTDQERRYSRHQRYLGSEIYLSLREPVNRDDDMVARELSVYALCSNRHLAGQLPVGEAGADFHLVDNVSVDLRCIFGPTAPRESIIHLERKNRSHKQPSELLWHLINFLTYNHIGMLNRSKDDKASGLREMLSLFMDLSDVVSEKRIRGILSIEQRPIVRRLRQANGFNAAKGIEISVTFDEKAYEGAGIIGMGAILDRFFADYATINNFTETVIVSKQRGVIKRWPPRTGTGALL